VCICAINSPGLVVWTRVHYGNLLLLHGQDTSSAVIQSFRPGHVWIQIQSEYS
jgi:hypothetical protein